MGDKKGNKKGNAKAANAALKKRQAAIAAALSGVKPKKAKTGTAKPGRSKTKRRRHGRH